MNGPFISISKPKHFLQQQKKKKNFQKESYYKVQIAYLFVVVQDLRRIWFLVSLFNYLVSRW